MNVHTILISREEAEAKLEQYKSIQGRRRIKEDDKLQSLYASVSKGARVLNLAAAFTQVGLNERREPKIAIARADWPLVQCFHWSMPGPNWGIRFSNRTNTWKGYVSDVNIPLNLPKSSLFPNALRSSVPHIPPSVRPKFGLHNYHILFEVKEWESYPVDPFLLRRIAGHLYVVEAEWELTDLEASLLSAMTQGT